MEAVCWGDVSKSEPSAGSRLLALLNASQRAPSSGWLIYTQIPFYLTKGFPQYFRRYFLKSFFFCFNLDLFFVGCHLHVLSSCHRNDFDQCKGQLGISLCLIVSS